MDKNNIFFDLDGTLTDPGIGITNCVMYALERFGITVEDRASLYDFIGPPLVDSFMKHFGFSLPKAEEARDVYRERFKTVGKFENTVYMGIPEMLSALVDAGKRLYVATSKPEEYAIQILDHFGLSRYFEGIYGATHDSTRCSKDAVIAYALESAGLEPHDVIMVGDRRYDVEGARINGMEAIGVTYGYGSINELKDADARQIVGSVTELKELLI